MSATNGRRPSLIQLDQAERQLLERWVRSPTLAQRVVTRSRIVLLLADGTSARETARNLRISRATVDLWRGRFEGGRCDVLLHDRPGRGRKPGIRHQEHQHQTSTTGDHHAG